MQNAEIVSKYKLMTLRSRQNKEPYKCHILRPAETNRKYGGSRRRLVSKDEDADRRALNFLTVHIYNHIFGIGGKGFCRELATGGSRFFGGSCDGREKGRSVVI